jgi:predicted transcriptional regulator
MPALTIRLTDNLVNEVNIHAKKLHISRSAYNA